jgi:hypothetical protein
MKNEILAEECTSLAVDIHKTYQYMPWTLKNEYVSRLKRQVQRLSEDVESTRDSQNASLVHLRLQNAVALVHECVPLMSLCLSKNLLTPILFGCWIKRLKSINSQLGAYLKPEFKNELADSVA